MCGIAGIATLGPSEDLLPAAERMAAAMKHRGPDSQGVQEFASCLLVNARLSIIARGCPCLVLMDRSGLPITAKLNNAAELRAELSARGHSFHLGPQRHGDARHFRRSLPSQKIVIRGMTRGN